MEDAIIAYPARHTATPKQTAISLVAMTASSCSRTAVCRYGMVVRRTNECGQLRPLRGDAQPTQCPVRWG